jgi:hypothetical protein
VSGARRLGLPQLLRAGARAVSQYTGTLFGLYLVQLVMVSGLTLVIWQILATRFAERPLFDEGVDGDLAALIEALRGAGATLQAISLVGVGAIILYCVLSWFLAGGLIAVLAERPTGRRETARVFGAGGAGHFLAFVRLGAISIVLHVLVLFIAMIGLGVVYPRIETALTLREVLIALMVGLTPAFLLLVVVWTVLDHARVELVLRRPSHPRLGATIAFLRACAYVFQRPLALAHVGVWVAAFLAVSFVYTWLSSGAAMLGTSGAIALFIVRQGVVMLRLALKVALVGGQVELGVTRPPPPRGAENE